MGRILTEADAGGGTTSYAYTQNNVLVTIGPAPTGENTKRRQLEYDSLGRLTSVCEMTSAAGSGTCGQTVPQTGYWTRYTYDALGNLLTVIQNAQAAAGSQQTRTYAYDFLSRLTSETNPESGTVNYVHDADATCGTFSGDLVKRTDAVGNTACYGYDVLHRITSITYSGPYAPNTPNKYFVYDGATVNSVVMVNAKNRLAEAYTATCPTCTKITDAGFSYSVRGETTDVYQSTPNSGGYYRVSATYWANGVLNQLSGLPGLPTITHGVDSQGRPRTVSATTGQNPVTSTVYNTASQPTQMDLGSLDSETFGYDPNTGRMTQYKFNVNGQSVIGNLTWNPNGTLGALSITDPFNSTNTQNCSYVHDDLARIQSFNCGSVWSQTFSYDAFGNINKSGSMAFQPTYAPTTNRMTSLPGFTPSYDANGNVLNDSFHQYMWDAEGRPVTIDTVGLTYDALSRMVEQNRSGSFTQIVWSPVGGKLALMSGQTLQKAFVPLPTGGTAVYTASGLSFYRHPDWLGSSRFASTPNRTMHSSTAYAPFGEAYAQAGTSDLSFTGQNQDTVGGSYDFLFREYAIQGRWPSPDPAGLAAVAFPDPQTLNRYAYVGNRPLTTTDPTGMFNIHCLFVCSEFFDLFGGLFDRPGLLEGCCDPFIPTGGIGTGSIGSTGPLWGELPPWGLPPWITPSGIDWQTLIFGRPRLEDVVINDWHFEGNEIMGDYRGEQLCDTNGRCQYWNPDTRRWQDDLPLSPTATSIARQIGADFPDWLAQKRFSTETCRALGWGGAGLATARVATWGTRIGSAAGGIIGPIGVGLTVLGVAGCL